MIEEKEYDSNEEPATKETGLSLLPLRQPSLGYILKNDQSNRSTMVPPPPPLPPPDESPIRRQSIGLSGLKPTVSRVNDDAGGAPYSSA